MEKIIADFTTYCHTHPEYVKEYEGWKSELVNDYMWSHALHGEDIFNALMNA